MDETKAGMTYREAGVDIDAANEAVRRITMRAREAFSLTTNGEGGPAGTIGHFGGLYRLPSGPDRLLVASADGVGTKLKLAFILGGDAHARMGADLVNHCVNDILALGAQPLFFLDYIGSGTVDPAAIERLVSGMIAACQTNGLVLIGGETAEMPDFYRAGEYDVAGFIVGEVAPEAVVDGSRIEAGDVLLGLPSGGLQTNGYSLARKIIGLGDDNAQNRQILARSFPGGSGETIGEALLAPHRSFAPLIQPLLKDHPGVIRGMAHITGGGLVENVPRMLPDGLSAQLDPTRWDVPPIFTYLIEVGHVPPAECYRAFNMGIGFVVAVHPNDVETALAALPDSVRIGGVCPRGAGEPAVIGLPTERGTR